MRTIGSSVLNLFPKNAHRLLMLLAISLTLILIALSRMHHFNVIDLEPDEVWSVWQTMGSPVQIVAWTPFDWGPLFYLLLGGWRALTGINPDILRVFPVLLCLVGCAGMFRLGKFIGGNGAGWWSMLVYASLTYAIYLTTGLRGYSLLIALIPLATWQAMRCFARPTFRRLDGACLVLLLSAIAYTHPTGILAIGAIGVLALAVYPNRWRRWIWPAVLTSIIIAPDLISKLQVIRSRVQAYAGEIGSGPTPSLQSTIPAGLQPLKTVEILFRDWMGDLQLLWVALIAVSFILLIARRRMTRPVFLMVLWFTLLPILLFFVRESLSLYSPAKHMLFTMIGFSVCVGIGLNLAPKLIKPILIVALIYALLAPIPTNLLITSTSFTSTFKALVKYAEVGDVIYLDPKLGYIPPEMWDYHTRLYFPQGLQVVTDPTGYRRVWYIRRDGVEDQAAREKVERRRIAATYFGPWDFFIRLYQQPPANVSVEYENGINLVGIEFPDTPHGIPVVVREGSTLRIRLWWEVRQAVVAPYSIGIGLLDQTGQVVAQVDGAPMVIDLVLDNAPPRLTQVTEMQPTLYYVDQRELAIKNPLPTGAYQLYVVVYDSVTGARVDAPTLGPDQLLIPMQIFVKSF